MRFRWLGRRGRILAAAARTSAVCRQPERRPDLVAVWLRVAPIPAHPQLDRYSALIANTGATAARDFEVRLTDGAVVRTRMITLLSPHSRRLVVFSAPACSAASPPRVVVDPLAQVDVSSRARASTTAACPAARAG